MKKKHSITVIGLVVFLIITLSSCADSMCPTFTKPLERIGMTNSQIRSYKERSSVPSPHSVKYRNKLVKKYSRL